MIGLHVMNNEIVGLFSAENFFQVFKPLFSEMLVHGVHNGDFLIANHVRIVRHSVFYLILTLEKVYVVVVYADV